MTKPLSRSDIKTQDSDAISGMHRRKSCKKYSQEPWFSLSTITQAKITLWSLTLIPTARRRVRINLLIRKVPSAATMRRHCWKVACECSGYTNIC